MCTSHLQLRTASRTISVAEFQRFIFLEPILVALGLCVLASRSESKHMCNSQRIKAGGLQEIASEDRGKKQQLKKKEDINWPYQEEENLFLTDFSQQVVEQTTAAVSLRCLFISVALARVLTRVWYQFLFVFLV